MYHLIGEARYAKPLIDRFKGANRLLALGKTKFSMGVRLDSIFSGKKHIVACDFSSFDASVNKKLIYMAFKTLETHFEFDSSERKLWDKLVHEFIYTKFFLMDGNIYMKEGGVPSGSHFTQLIDSIITASVMS